MTPTKRERVGAAGPAEATTGTAAIQGFEQAVTDEAAAENWRSVSERKIRVGIAGFGVCGFGAAFHFQDHPNVTVAAVADLDPDKCAELAKRCRCETMYPSCEELIGDDSLEAIFIATDAPSHARLAIASLNAGKHVASAVPAVFGSLEDADLLFAAVKASDRKYMMFETRRPTSMMTSIACGRCTEPATWARSSTPKASTGTTSVRRCPRTRDGAPACPRSGIPRTRTPTMWV